MKRILFPTDFSEIADNAFLYALKMADSLEAEIMLLHTFDMPIIDGAEIPINFKEMYDSLELQQMAHFQDYIPKLQRIADAHGMGHIKITHLLKSGDLTFAMQDAVGEHNISLVVMGTSGVSNWFDSLFGSQTGEAITSLTVPVLSIPIEARYKKIKTIAFTNLYREKDFEALERLVEIALKFNASIKSLYVKKSSSTISDEEIKIWEGRCSAWPVQFFVVPHDDVKETIQDFINNQHIDMLTMLTERRGFWEDFFSSSLTKKMSYKIDIPMLALHERSSTNA
ncbi:nucleotide-binding universal stress UspA family protein [Flavobacterium gossypii]|uniref:Nucleotide-binding universal stress UspA family protein n=1 Tax=Flavobacterium gossypii TaxID=1646119 RepID=A0ABR6DJM5_9FLAO|nr:universal stress protein [Flavobacterium gossypii]MBA9071889.1 nucleotide-binding universal stress UspA family protein [Flavobacterium gossypii]